MGMLYKVHKLHNEDTVLRVLYKVHKLHHEDVVQGT